MRDVSMHTIQQFPSWFAKQKLSGKLAIGCASLIILCCLCSVPIAILNPSKPTPKVTQTEIVEISPIPVMESATKTVTPVVAALTTETNIPTITPTNTLAPIPTLKPTPSQEILTIENNKDMAALFKVSDSTPFINEFAKKYSGRIIQFDGYIANMMPHDGYKTRFDLLIYTGNNGESSGNGLNFKFEDVNVVSDLKLTGSSIPENISEGQNLRITAEVVEYDEVSGLFFLKPVSTEIRP
jgi:hypothetical protein